MSSELRVCVLVPAFNEAGTIASVVRSVLPCGAVLVVDDGSTDDTARLAADAGADVLTLDPNLGYEGALGAGFAEASARACDVVVTFDADGQFAGDVAARVLAPVLTGQADLALGQRPRAARFGEAVFSLYTRLRFGVRDILCGVKAYRMSLYRAHGRFDDGRSIGTELALAAMRRGARVAVIDVDVAARQVGASRFGQGWRANRKILGALRRAVCADIRRQDVQAAS